MKGMKTNPVYASLAYRRTVLHRTITFLKREFIGIDEDPKQKIICEEVLASDAEVPVEEIVQFVEELEREHHALTLELGKFEFSRRENNGAKQRTKKKKSN